MFYFTIIITNWQAMLLDVQKAQTGDFHFRENRLFCLLGSIPIPLNAPNGAAARPADASKCAVRKLTFWLFFVFHIFRFHLQQQVQICLCGQQLLHIRSYISVFRVVDFLLGKQLGILGV